jgi:hypothetical protein
MTGIQPCCQADVRIEVQLRTKPAQLSAQQEVRAQKKSMNMQIWRVHSCKLAIHYVANNELMPSLMKAPLHAASWPDKNRRIRRLI